LHKFWKNLNNFFIRGPKIFLSTRSYVTRRDASIGVFKKIFGSGTKKVIRVFRLFMRRPQKIKKNWKNRLFSSWSVWVERVPFDVSLHGGSWAVLGKILGSRVSEISGFFGPKNFLYKEKHKKILKKPE
jgi:hypothetical protein